MKGSVTRICFRARRVSARQQRPARPGALLHDVERPDRSVLRFMPRVPECPRGVHPDVETFSLDTQAMLADKPGRGST